MAETHPPPRRWNRGRACRPRTPRRMCPRACKRGECFERAGAHGFRLPIDGEAAPDPCPQTLRTWLGAAASPESFPRGQIPTGLRLRGPDREFAGETRDRWPRVDGLAQSPFLRERLARETRVSPDAESGSRPEAPFAARSDRLADPPERTRRAQAPWTELP